MKPVFEASFALRAPDTDFCGTWRPGAIFTAMQELGEAHSAQLNAGYFALREKGLAWVVTRILLQIDRAPQIGEAIRARTWPGRERHAIYPRYYAFDDDRGNSIARASSLWVLMDIASREMVPGEKHGIAGFDEVPLPPTIENPGGIPKVEGEVRRATRAVVPSDLDINRHVNNARYVDWLWDQFSYEWHEKNRLERVIVHFTGETRPGEALDTALCVNGMDFWFAGERDGHKHFAMGGHFTAREQA